MSNVIPNIDKMTKSELETFHDHLKSGLKNKFNLFPSPCQLAPQADKSVERIRQIVEYKLQSLNYAEVGAKLYARSAQNFADMIFLTLPRWARWNS
jgi:hypothetical protein